MSHQVFISYSAEDKDVADRIGARLEDRGIRCWIAPRDIPPGQLYSRAIVNALESAGVMVLVFSKESNTSRHCLGEVELAFSSDVNIVPFRIQDVMPSDEMRYFLRTSQWLDAFQSNVEKHLDDLVEAVDFIVNHSVLDESPRDPASDSRDDFRRPPQALEAEKKRPGRRSFGLGKVLALVLPVVILLAAVFFAWTAGLFSPDDGVENGDRIRNEARNKALKESASQKYQAAARLRRAGRRVAAERLFPDLWEKAESLLAAGRGALEEKDYLRAEARCSQSLGAFAEVLMKSLRAGLEDEENSREDVQKLLRSTYELLQIQPSNAEAAQLARSMADRLALTNSLDMELVYIPPGDFLMGSPESEIKGKNDFDERLHRRVIDEGFYISSQEVTREQFAAFVDETGYRTEAEKRGRAWVRTDGFPKWKELEFELGGEEMYFWKTPRMEQDEGHPAVLVSWRDAVEFCRWLSRKEGRRYRLPTEPEWEYACRAGTRTPFSTGETITPDQANYCGEKAYPPEEGPLGVFRKKSLPVGSFDPNAWGVFDMHGNVWEWCQDPYLEQYPDEDDETQPPTAENPEYVRRGGGWASNPLTCRSANRWKLEANVAREDTGFRVVLKPE